MKRCYIQSIGIWTGVLTLSFCLPARSDVIGWYRMEGTPDTQISSVANSSGTAPGATASGEPFNYSSEVVGPSIYDPLTGLTHANNSSMAFYGGTASAYLEVTDTVAGPFDVPDFTIEMFMKIDSVLNVYRYWVSHKDGTDGWTLRSVPIAGSVDSYKASGLVVNGTFSDTSSPDRIDDGVWHHFAFVVKSTGAAGANYAKVYMDYSLIASNRNTNLDTYVADVAAPFRIFAEEYLGNVDEVRFTSSELTPDQFLQAIPEPGTLLLFLSGLAMLFSARRASRRRSP